MVAIRSTRSILGAALAALLAACKGSEPGPVPTTVVITPAAVTLDAIDATQQLAWTVQDQNGVTMDTVTWSSANAGVATVNPAGVVQGRGVGATTVRATVTSRTSVSGTADVTLTQVPATILKIGGEPQIGAAGRALLGPMTVQVNDRLGKAISGASVNFAVTQGGGSVAPASAITSPIGQVSTTWTMGTTAGSVQQMTSTAATGAGTATFNATVVAGPPANVSKQAGDGQTAAAGTPVVVDAAVVVRDEYGNLKGGAQVTFAVASGGGNVTGAIQATNASGVATVGSWILGFAGENTLTATVTGSGVTGNPATFTATALAPGAPASIAALEGDNQTGLATYTLNVPPAVVVKDASNNPVGGVAVDFAVASGGGAITGASTTTDITGVARVGSWAVQLGANTLTATATGSGIAGNPLTLTATGVTSSFTVELQFLSTLTASQQAAFTNAKNKWETLVFGDRSDISFAPPDSAPPGTCGANSPAITDVVDDVRIFVTVVPIDGPGRILGQAGPCYIRLSDNLPVVGRMLFDDADLASLENDGILEAVILHEMGHVLGIGTVWRRLNLLADAASSGGVDPHFTGGQAIAAFDRIGGAGYTGQKVPVENTGGGGTADAHWRESVFGRELMTGFVNSGVNPLSVVTTASLGDEGYLVNYAGSDAFTLTLLAATRTGAQTTVELKDDVLRQPIYVVDRRGRVVRVIQP